MRSGSRTVCGITVLKKARNADCGHGIVIGGKGMATYKQPCIRCGELIERDSRFCPKCASRSPFGNLCPSCLKPIERGNLACSGCGRPLTTACPYCSAKLFVGDDKCSACGKSVMIQCDNKLCGQYQFFENAKCTSCGKPIKTAKKQIAKEKKNA